MCSGHYQQHYSGRQLTELRHYSERMTLEDAERIVERITAGETIVAIGKDTGYDPSSIARVFARVTGLSVREFKKSRGAQK
jgi:AraC-like DNA-binding protein